MKQVVQANTNAAHLVKLPQCKKASFIITINQNANHH